MSLSGGETAHCLFKTIHDSDFGKAPPQRQPISLGIKAVRTFFGSDFSEIAMQSDDPLKCVHAFFIRTTFSMPAPPAMLLSGCRYKGCLFFSGKSLQFSLFGCVSYEEIIFWYVCKDMDSNLWTLLQELILVPCYHVNDYSADAKPMLSPISKNIIFFFFRCSMLTYLLHKRKKTEAQKFGVKTP